jgi:hypothetical protein
MNLNKTFEIANIEELKILSNVRLLKRHELNPIYSKENLHVQFQLNGHINGVINCFLCLDGHELNAIDKNVLFPLFVESMNILIGKQISEDPEFSRHSIKLSPPKFSMKAQEINSSLKKELQTYHLELDGYIFSIITEYILGVLN